VIATPADGDDSAVLALPHTSGALVPISAQQVAR